MSLSLAGRSAIVTGASRGIGLATARQLAAAGVRVAMIARSGAALTASAAEIGELATAVICDLTDDATVSATLRKLVDTNGGPPDIIVNNAGLFTLAPIELTSPEQFGAALQTNLVAPFLLLHAILPAMRTRGSGHVVTIGSIADRAAFAGNGAYAASKFGLRGLHEVLRQELRGSGVRATLISPGPVDTSLWDPIDPDTREGFTPRAAMLTPEMVADAVLYTLGCPPEMNVDELRLTRT
jgi:NADP-dependent 3-hydroxy acid dehydrogenase YdfG